MSVEFGGVGEGAGVHRPSETVCLFFCFVSFCYYFSFHIIFGSLFEVSMSEIGEIKS